VKLSDYIVQFLADQGLGHIFGVTGGAVVHLFDSAERSGRLQPIFHHHEQAAAFAAQAYARANGTLGSCFVTTGPGVTNALTGLAAAWLDSVPCIYISGQVRFAHTAQGKSIRQVGTQHLEVVPLVRPMTKYAALVEDAVSIRYHLEKAFHFATSGRPGPVWLDLPLDLQWADIDPSVLRGFRPEPEDLPVITIPTDEALETCLKWLHQSERPLLLAGYGVPLSRAQRSFGELVDRHDLPFVTTWGACDVLPSAHRGNLGRPGMVGQRGANLAVQNCDLLIALGSHLCIPVTGTMFNAFARTAKIIMVDIDPDELTQRTIAPHLPILADVKSFLARLLERLPASVSFGSDLWRATCESYRTRYLAPPLPDATLTAYDFVRVLSDLSADDDIIVVDGGGTNVYVSFQTFAIKGRQRMILSTGLCAMGSGLPESIGACYGSGGRRTLCLCGDGSMQLNIQELQTIKHHRLPIKIFITDNGGYLSIRETQKTFLKANYVGSESDGGMSLPDYAKIAAAYGLPVITINCVEDLCAGLNETLSSSGPVVCIVRCSPVQQVIPRQAFDRKPNGTFEARPLEDMAPLLDREEFTEAMLTPQWSPSLKFTR
jgi:acetolactate synthase-1/2/3 large subunit